MVLDNLEASSVALDVVSRLPDMVVVSPDAGGVDRAKAFQGRSQTHNSNSCVLAEFQRNYINLGLDF